MKISYISDLHLDFHVPFTHNQIKWEKRTKEFINKLIETDEGDKEVLVVAGDISHFNAQSMWILETFSEVYEKVMFVMGNHDYYLVSNNQASKYNGNSTNRAKELLELSESIDNVHSLHDGDVVEFKGIKFGGCSMWYPVETFEQQNFFHGVSNDSRLIKGFNIQQEHLMDQYRYNSLLNENIDVMVSHFPVINIDSHFKYNSTACYLTPVKDINVSHWVMAHSHEQKVYEKPYCTFYMNAIGYKEEKLPLNIKHFAL